MGDLTFAERAMTVAQHFHEGALTLEQWQHVEALARSLSPVQARWISGYFAGLDAGLLRGGGVEAAPEVAPAGRTLTILYGTETGNARDLGKALAAAAAERGLTPRLFDMADYKVRQLKDEEDLLVIVSTYGEGDPPQPAIGFFEFLEGRRAPRLPNLRYSVLALGDSTYEKYCEAGKRIDRRLRELGAAHLHDRVDCDLDYEEPAAGWSGTLVDQLAAEGAERSAEVVRLFPTTAPVPTSTASPAYDKRNPFPARVLDSIRITGRHSTKDTRHIELDLAGSGLAYEPGDSLGIVAGNDPAVVARLLEATGLGGETTVSVKGESLSLAEALERRFEITIASPRFVDQWAKLSGTAALERLTGEDAAAERHAFLHGHHIVDIVRLFPVGRSGTRKPAGGPASAAAAALFDRLQPRRRRRGSASDRRAGALQPARRATRRRRLAPARRARRSPATLCRSMSRPIRTSNCPGTTRRSS